MFTKTQSVLILVDLQEKLVPHVMRPGPVVEQARKLVAFARIMGLPLLVTEQYPEGIGPTVAELRKELGGVAPIAKRTFSCCGEPRFMQALEALGRRQVILAGVETHVCIFQTAADLAARGYAVQVLADAVSSRTEANIGIGLERIRAAGGAVSSLESTVFELLHSSEAPEFKAVLKLVK